MFLTTGNETLAAVQVARKIASFNSGFNMNLRSVGVVHVNDADAKNKWRQKAVENCVRMLVVIEKRKKRE